MTMRKIIAPVTILLGILLNTTEVTAQEKIVVISYNMALPTAGTSDYISAFSFRGIGIDTRHFIKEDFSIGFSGSWNVFNEELENYTSTEGTVTVHGSQYRYLNAFPLLVNLSYYKGDADKLRYYGGVGIGTMHANQRTYIGIYALELNTWHFSMAPELGILYPVSEKIILNFNLRYYFAFKSGSASSISYLGINVGIGF